jgi:hypothetical protein
MLFKLGGTFGTVHLAQAHQEGRAAAGGAIWGSVRRPSRAMIEKMRQLCRLSKHAERFTHRFPQTLAIGLPTGGAITSDSVHSQQ